MKFVDNPQIGIKCLQGWVSNKTVFGHPSRSTVSKKVQRSENWTSSGLTPILPLHWIGWWLALCQPDAMQSSTLSLKDWQCNAAWPLCRRRGTFAGTPSCQRRDLVKSNCKAILAAEWLQGKSPTDVWKQERDEIPYKSCNMNKSWEIISCLRAEIFPGRELGGLHGLNIPHRESHLIGKVLSRHRWYTQKNMEWTLNILSDRQHLHLCSPNRSYHRCLHSNMGNLRPKS